MKFWFHQQLKKTLRVLAIATLRKYRPGIIGVTGSVGKTSAKEAIYAVLRQARRVRPSFKSFNDQIGLPVTILGDWPEEKLKLISRYYTPGKNLFRKIFFWVGLIMSSILKILFGKQSQYPEILILEYGADRPGDLNYLIGIARPQVAVITAVGELPVHVEFYDNAEAVAREKSKLVQALPTNGFAVLNHDDPQVLVMKKLTPAPVFTFGFSAGADVRITAFEHRHDQGRPVGSAFTLEYNGQSAPVRMEGVLGKPQAYAAAAAACVGLGFGLHLPRIAEALGYYKSPFQRLKFLPGIKDTHVIDDSYNASPLSMRAALETLHDFPAKRRVAILGDMRELGAYADEAHREIGALAARVAHLLITVGSKGALIAEEAIARGMRPERVRHYDRAEQVAIDILGLLKSGDLVLIKASRSIGLEVVVEQIVYK